MPIERLRISASDIVVGGRACKECDVCQRGARFVPFVEIAVAYDIYCCEAIGNGRRRVQGDCPVETGVIVFAAKQASRDDSSVADDTDIVRIRLDRQILDLDVILNVIAGICGPRYLLLFACRSASSE